jgi:hypothetical protein
MKVRIPITEEQAALLEPLFSRVRENNISGVGSVIAAQVLPDGAIVKFLSGKKGKALCEALGGNIHKGIYSFRKGAR